MIVALVRPAPPARPPRSRPPVKLSLLEVNPLHVDGWNAGVARLPGASVFHREEWARLLQETYGYTPVYFITGDPASPSSVLPTMHIRSWLTGRRGVSLPFTDECAPLIGPEVEPAAFLEAVLQAGRQRGWKHLELRGGQEQWSQLRGHQASTTYWNHRLALDRPEEELLTGCDKAHRGAIKKAQSNGLEIESSCRPEAMRDFYRLFCLTRRRHGVPPPPWAFFARLQSRLLAADLGTIILARHQGQAIAGAVFLYSGTTVHYKYGASDDTQQHLRGNNLVMWTAIRHHARTGFSTLDFGRTSLYNAGLRRFKAGWGTAEHALSYTKVALPGPSYLEAPDRSAGWYTPVFQRLPLPVAGLLGGALYRHIG